MPSTSKSLPQFTCALCPLCLSLVTRNPSYLFIKKNPVSGCFYRYILISGWSIWSTCSHLSLEPFPDSPPHSNAASRYCHSTIFTCNSLNFRDLPVKQANILHSSLNPFLDSKYKFIFCLLRVTTRVEPAWKWEHLNEMARQWLQEQSTHLLESRENKYCQNN